MKAETLPRTDAATDIARLTELLAVPDPQPDEPWTWRTSRSRTVRMVESLGQIRDLVAGLPDDEFLIISHGWLTGVFTQCWRTGDRFHTECALPGDSGTEIWVYADEHTHDGERLHADEHLHAGADGRLSMGRCIRVMTDYVRLRGDLPQLDGCTMRRIRW